MWLRCTSPVLASMLLGTRPSTQLLSPWLHGHVPDTWMEAASQMNMYTHCYSRLLLLLLLLLLLPGFLCKAGGGPGDWTEVLAVLPEAPHSLPPAITLQVRTSTWLQLW
jgi:hypothetical protein